MGNGLATEEHSFVAITVERVDARLAADGTTIEYSPAPERQADSSPEHFCEVCWQPLDHSSLNSKCPGPKVPDDLRDLLG